MLPHALVSLVLLAHILLWQQSQNPSPMVENARAHPRLQKVSPPGRREKLELGTLFLPAKIAKQSQATLLMFFHGGDWLPEVAASRRDLAVVTVQAGAGSSTYEKLFSDPSRFGSLIDEAQSKAGVVFTSIELGGWSAGCGAIRQILLDPASYRRVNRVLCIDGIHTAYVNGKPGPKESEIDIEKLQVFVKFARDAVAGSKRLLVTHSEIFPGTFASTTETSDYLVKELGLPTRPVVQWGPMGTQILSESRAGGFTLIGFAGNSAPDHVDQLHSLPDYLEWLNGKVPRWQQSTLIRHALVIDGTGAAGRKLSVRIAADRIQAIGQLQPRQGEQVIDATGLVLAPGFIDMHNHSDKLDADLNAASQVSQGITTVLVGQDGGSSWPIADYLAKRRSNPASLNLQTLVGHATIRTQVMDKDYKRKARPEEIVRMTELVDQAMRDGAVGLSSGLEYEVGSYSTTEELIALAKAAAKHRGLYVSHVRDEGDHALDSFREEIRIGEEARLPVEISHIKLGTAAVWGKAADVVHLVEAARKRGLDVTADCYPYDAWASGITVLVLDKQYDNAASVGKGLADVGGAENVTITSCKAHSEYEGHTLAELAKTQSISAVALYSRIVREGGAGVVCKAMKDADIRLFYRQPWVMVGSDGGLGMRHPRGAGTYPRVLGEYVRERNWLTLPEAIRKMTSAPAARLKLSNRGVVKEGAFADLVLFDAKRVRDRATFAQPFELSEGIEKVFVNGQMVWSDGKATGNHPGRVLK